jgi:chromosome segregation ATPase
MKSLEKKLKQLVKKQSSSIEDLKGYHIVKKELMNDIVKKMSDAMEDKSVRRKLDRSKDQIELVNGKIIKLETLLGALPKEIYDTNQGLMDESMSVFYRQVKSSKKELEHLVKDIAQLRETIKSKMLDKNDIDKKYTSLYQYIHGLVGAEKIEIYDKKYLDD